MMDSIGAVLANRPFSLERNVAHGMERELETLARINGHDDVHDLNVGDMLTMEYEISRYSDIEHA